MELKDLDPAIEKTLNAQRADLEEEAKLFGGRGAFARIGLRTAEPFQHALTDELLRRTPPEDIMNAVGRQVGFQITTTALQFMHMVPVEDRDAAPFIMVQAMLMAAADYAKGMIKNAAADKVPGVSFSIRESGPCETVPLGRGFPHA